MPRNVGEIKKIRDFLAEHPSQHKQEVWALVPGSSLSQVMSLNDYGKDFIECGTQACAAGWTSLLAGDKIASADPSWRHRDEAVTKWTVDKVRTPDGRIKRVSTRAQEILGLGWTEADELFHANNELQNMLLAMDAMIAGVAPKRVIKFLRRSRGDDRTNRFAAVVDTSLLQ